MIYLIEMFWIIYIIFQNGKNNVLWKYYLLQVVWQLLIFNIDNDMMSLYKYIIPNNHPVHYYKS